MPKVSVIIPCYNHGKYIDEAIASVEQTADKSLYEIIIINDGSTDPFTNQRLQELHSLGYQVIFQENGGLSAARNMGISLAKGKYILPLDADNKIRPEYIHEGIRIFEQQANVSIIYGDASLFGEKQGIKKSYDFNLQHLMLGNYIDACAIYRKAVWDELGGYDIRMRTGLEDWEFWLHAAFRGFKFQYINKVLFDYRVLQTSMVHQLNKKKSQNIAITDYLTEKHQAYFGPQFIDADLMHKFSQSPVGFTGKLFLKKFFPSLFMKQVQKGRLRKYI